MGQQAISLNDVHVSLGRGAARVHILKGISLNVDTGDAVGLTGPSGSGKSTLLAVLAGLERPDRGTVTVGGTRIDTLSEDDLARFRGSRIGIVFQSFHLIPTMTALENVAVPLELAGRRGALDRAEAELRQVGLGERLSHYPSQLSGGEQQRVALARALAPDPAILVADEPTGNLDEATGRSIMDLIFEQRARRGATPGSGHPRSWAGGALRPHHSASVGRGRDGAIRAGQPLPHGGPMNAPASLPVTRRPALWATVLRLAGRDLRGGLGGYWIFLLCIALAWQRSVASARSPAVFRTGWPGKAGPSWAATPPSPPCRSRSTTPSGPIWRLAGVSRPSSGHAGWRGTTAGPRWSTSRLSMRPIRWPERSRSTRSSRSRPLLRNTMVALASWRIPTSRRGWASGWATRCRSATPTTSFAHGCAPSPTGSRGASPWRRGC